MDGDKMCDFKTDCVDGSDEISAVCGKWSLL